eukprot:jgi/Tetstr1/464187/TSEL_008992.t1
MKRSFGGAFSDDEIQDKAADAFFQDSDPCGSPLAPCGCSGRCVFGDDIRDSEGEGEDPDADWCAEVSWSRAAEIVRENDRLMYFPDRVQAMESWVQNVVIPRWRVSASKAALRAADFDVLSDVVHRLHVGSLMRLRIMPRFQPRFQFVMKHPARANPNIAESVMIKMDPPVRWVAASRDPDGIVRFRRDGDRVAVDMKALTPETYGVTWAESVEPSPRPPVFLPPDRVASIPEGDRHWYVYSAGVGAWVPARRGGRGGSVEWVQKFPDPPCGVEYPILDVGGEMGNEEYGRDAGVLAPLYDGDTTRVYDRLVLHPQYEAKWIGVYEGDGGRHYAYGYPDDVEVECDLRPENFNVTWCWPPCLTD